MYDVFAWLDDVQNTEWHREYDGTLCSSVHSADVCPLGLLPFGDCCTDEPPARPDAPDAANVSGWTVEFCREVVAYADSAEYMPPAHLTYIYETLQNACEEQDHVCDCKRSYGPYHRCTC